MMYNRPVIVTRGIEKLNAENERIMKELEMTKQEEIGTIISSDRPNFDDAMADDKLIVTIVIYYPKARYSPGDTIIVRNESNGN